MLTCTQVTFQGVQTYKAKPDVYAMIINNPNQKGYCHMFYVNTGVGTSITTAMTGTLKEATAAFDKVAKKADKNVFTVRVHPVQPLGVSQGTPIPTPPHAHSQSPGTVGIKSP